ncbi:CRP/FNR family transcriptional regulator [Virgibacillus campisalis]|uniref:CRP/FNR family transcriptional regulator n=2 Tax=Virgibacillus alimentarius TaxID=698769 RepID=A0ABS4SB65_9BACI|nr:CRP/FNR family transcriptional regulator [Virgibacillus alimentarius]
MQMEMLAYSHENNVISKQLYTLLNEIGTPMKKQQNEYLFHSGMDANEIFLLKSGLVHIALLTSDGKELSLRICKKGDIVGELTVFSDNPQYLLSAKVIEPGELLVINREKLERELMTNSALTFEFMKWISDHMRKFQLKIRDLLLHGKKGALYSTLIRLSNSFGKKQGDGILIDLVLTNQELANFCSATRESINRMLTDLRNLDVIAMTKKGEILIKDIAFLRNEIGCELCPIQVCNIN